MLLPLLARSAPLGKDHPTRISGAAKLTGELERSVAFGSGRHLARKFERVRRCDLPIQTVPLRPALVVLAHRPSGAPAHNHRAKLARLCERLARFQIIVNGGFVAPRSHCALIPLSISHSGDGGADRAGIAVRPAAAFHLREKVANDAVIFLRLLDIDRMPGIGDDRERG